MNHLWRTLLILSLLLTAVTAPAADTPRHKSLRQLTTSDHLSDLLVNAIYKDSRGFVWFGTERALDRFDGNQIRSFRFPNDANNSNRINAIAETPDGTIWVGNHRGLFFLAPGAAQLQQAVQYKITSRVNALIPGPNNTLYIGTRHGLYVYDTKTHSLTQKLLFPDVMNPENEVTGLAYDKKHGLVILMPHTLGLYSESTGNLVSLPIPSDASARHLALRGDQIFIGTEGDGIIPFYGKTRTFGAPISLGNDIVTTLNITGNTLYAGTDGEGIYEYSLRENRVMRHLTTSPDSELPLRSNSVYSMLVDQNGLLWIGYYQAGAEYTPKPDLIFSTYKFGDINTARYSVRSLAVDGPRKLIGTQEGLLYTDESTGRTAEIHKPEIDSNLIFSILPWNGRFYVATYYGGMYVFDPQTFSISRFCPQLASATVFDIEKDRHNNLWIGTSQGVYRFTPSSDKPAQILSSANSQLPPGNVYEIFFDSNGRGWFCTEKGMALWDGASLQASGFPKGFINNQKIRVVYEDSNHFLYFAPDRGDVWRSNLELTKFAPLKSAIGGREVMITAIIEDKDGTLWFGTDRGLFHTDGLTSFDLFNNADGVANPVFTLCKPTKLPDGNLLFGTTKGLLQLDYKEFTKIKNQKTAKIVITDIASNGHTIFSRLNQKGDTPEISLSDKENDLAISLTDFSYIDPQYAEVEYRLDGVDDGWLIGAVKDPIHYYDLKPGNYTLRVRVPGNPDTETTLSIRHSSGFPLMTLTIIIVVICLAAGAFTIIAIRARHRQQLDEMNERLSRKAAAEAASAEGGLGDAGGGVAGLSPGGNAARVDGAETSEQEKKSPYGSTRLSDEECKRIMRKIEAIMKKERPFTNPKLKIGELAAMAGTTAHALSFIFNQYLQRSYYDYVNEYRVNEFKRLSRELDMSKYTLSAVAEKCGFSSRASFFRHFKSFTGQTPSEFLNTPS